MELPERVAILENQMDRVEEGISNFRSFQVEAREFFTRADERAKAEMAFHNTRDREIKDTLALSNQRTNFLMLIIAALSLIAAVAGVFIGVREYQRKISLAAPTSISQQPQSAELPNTR